MRHWTIISAGILLALIGAVSLVGYRVGFARGETLAGAHYDSRSAAILSQASQRDWPVVVLGDSMTELATLGRLCDQPTLNAGISGARVSDLNRLAEPLLDQVEPELVVIAVGTNDSWATDPTDPDRFASEYQSLIARAQQSGARVVAVNTMPVAPDGVGKANIFDREALKQRNAQIAELGIPVLDVASVMDDGSGRMKIAYTDDGVHPNAAGYAQWQSVLQEACELPAPSRFTLR